MKRLQWQAVKRSEKRGEKKRGVCILLKFYFKDTIPKSWVLKTFFMGSVCLKQQAVFFSFKILDLHL